MPTLTSGNVTLLDLTDTKKIDLHITSNHPTVQIYDKNNPQEPLTPDWQKNPLVLTPVVYIDSEPMKDYSGAIFTWTKIVGVATNDNDGEFITNNMVLTRIDNEDLDNSPTIRYRCKIEYNNKSFFNEITFARIDNGVSAPTVQAQYSVDGTDGTWETGLDPAIHQYIHFSYDGGHSWTAPIKIVGEAGQSISLKGTAYTNDELVVNGVVVLYSDEAKQNQINGENPGDSYLVDGYLCVYNGSQFICNGQLQGPKGDTYYLYIRYANDTSGSDFSETPGNRKYVGFYRSTVTPLPTNIDKTSATWNWAKFAGEDAKSVVLSASAQAFKIDKNNTILPSTITVTAQTFNTTIPDSGWTYSTDGKTFVSSIAGVERVGDTVTITGSQMTSNLIVVKAQSGAYMDMFTVYKVIDGADGAPGGKGDSAPVVFLTNENISFAANANGQVVKKTTVICDVVAYNGTIPVTPTVGTILPADIPNGMTISKSTISNQVRLTIVVDENATLGSTQSTNGEITIPITNPNWADLKLTWSKINSGANGSSASLVDITPSALYFKSNKGKDGTFTPEFIYLYPRFQNATYSNWQYSIDGGVNWVAASGANGLTISTYSSVANTLRISRASTLYTDTVTSISFRCNSTTSGVYDTVSIGKLFDVDVEEINTRITDSLAEVKTTTDSIASRVSTTETSIANINNNVSSITTRISAAEQKITPNAIVSTVRQSTDYTNDLGKKVNSTDVISTINQTAGSVTINANKIGLLGATNIPDLTADKIKGGTLTLGGSSATTQNGQLLVKNASNVDMLKVNKDGIIVKSGHLAVARDFTNQTYDWNTNTWTNSTNTSQLDLGDNFIRMGAYGASGYANSMTLLDDGLYFQGSAHAIGNWDSFVGHDDLGDFVIQETVRSNIYFRGAGDMEMARISGNGLHVGGPISGGITSGNARLFTNVFVKNFPSQPTGYICVKLGSATLAQSSMITIKGHITSYQNSTSFEASCYFYSSTGTFYGGVATMTNPDVLREVYFAERNGYAYLILGASNAVWSYPTVAIDSLSVGFAGNTASEWTYGWDAVTYTNITSNFTKIAACTRGGLNTTLWTGAILSNTTITVSENIRNFKFLTCIMGDASSPWGITMGAFMDSDLTELHFGAIYTDANSIAGANLYGVRFNINSPTSLTMQSCGTKSGGGAYMRKIVGWR